MATVTLEILTKAKKALPHRTHQEILALEWTAVENESKHKTLQSDEEVIERMKELDKIYQDNYNELSKYNYNNRVLQRQLEAILYDSNFVKISKENTSYTYGEFADLLGYGEEAISRASRTGNASKSLQKSVELFLENQELKEQLKKYETLKNTLKEILNT